MLGEATNTSAAAAYARHSTSRASSRSRSSNRESSSSAVGVGHPGSSRRHFSSTRVAAISRNSVTWSKSSASRSLGHLGEVGVDDAAQRHLVDVHLLRRDEVQEQVEGTLEDRRADLVGHRGRYRYRPSAGRGCPWSAGMTGRVRPGHALPWPHEHGSSPASQPSGGCTSATTSGRFVTGSPYQYDHDSFFCVVDLHALTIGTRPGDLRGEHPRCRPDCCAAGLDPDVCTLFVQSHVPEHTELTWLLECTAIHGRAAAHDPVQGEGRGPGGGPGRASSPTRC